MMICWCDTNKYALVSTAKQMDRSTHKLLHDKDMQIDIQINIRYFLNYSTEKHIVRKIYKDNT